jgi:hypothetical protein
MSKIELVGYLNEQGQLEFAFELPEGFPPGEVRITVEPLGPAESDSEGQVTLSGVLDAPPDGISKSED